MMEDSFRIRQDRTLMGRYLDHLLVQKQCPIHMFHQFYIIQLDILIGKELELELEMGLNIQLQWIEMEMTHSSSIRSSCRLRMQLQLELWL